MRQDMSAPAFPVAANRDAEIGQEWGMTKREYLAAHAPITISDAVNLLGYTYPLEQRDLPNALTTLATMRYAYADAMLSQAAA